MLVINILNLSLMLRYATYNYSVAAEPESWTMIIISAITIIVGGILGGVFTLLNTRYRYRLEEKQKKILTMKEKVKVSYSLKKYLREMRIETEADRASLCLYHNGETFISGLKIDRFSMHQEDVAPGIEPISHHFQGLSVANYPITTYDLLFDKVILGETVNGHHEDSMKVFCEKMNIKSFYMFLLETDREKPLGFVTISYEKEKILEKDQILFIQTYLHKIVRLITDNYKESDLQLRQNV